MRLGEIRNTAQAATDESNRISIDHDVLYDGQAYLIKNYSRLVDALDILSEQSWNEIDYSPIMQLKEKYGSEAEPVQITAEEFGALSAYVSAVNERYPIYISLVRSIVQDQDEKVINIKLPEKEKSLEDLTSLNTKLDSLFKKFMIDGEVKLVGFDTGTKWYVMLITGTGTYSAFIACLKAGQEWFKLRTEYFKSKQAELDYKASLTRSDEATAPGLTRYKKRRMDLELERLVTEVNNAITDKNGRTEEELASRLVKATKELVKELGDGVEFHLSLNPPEYASERSGQLVIDYKKIRELNKQRDKKQPQIPAPSDE